LLLHVSVPRNVYTMYSRHPLLLTTGPPWRSVTRRRTGVAAVAVHRPACQSSARRSRTFKEADMIYSILVGLIAGWLAGQVMKGGGYGVLMDIVLGLLGGIVGGWVFGALGLWPGGGIVGSIVVSF